MILQFLADTATAAASTATSSTAPANPLVWHWYLIATLCLLISSIASGSEIGIFSLSRVRLRLRAHQNRRSAVILSQWLRQPTNVLEGLLVIQNIAGFVFAAAVTNILTAYGFGENSTAVISTLIVTPLILILADIAPKDLFNTHADSWMYPLAPVYRAIFFVLTVIPVLPLIRFLSHASTYYFRKRGAEEISTPRAEIVKLFQESTATGVISSAQQDIVQRALRLARITVGDVMIPWPDVIGVPQSISREGFRALVRRYPVSRLPVLGRSTTEVLGLVEVLDVLAAPDQTAPLSKHLRPHMTLIAEQDVRSAITLMQRAKQTIAIVIDRQGRAAGIVTLKDLIEQLVGDLESW
jgi:CBS domain containing-hemolysin-like protein